MSNAEIGRDLFVSEHSVKSRMQAIFDELGVRDRAAAVRVGLECGAISLVPRARSGPVDRVNPAGASQGLQVGQTPIGRATRPPRPSQAATGPLRPSPVASTPRPLPAGATQIPKEAL